MQKYYAEMAADYGTTTLPGGRYNTPNLGVGKDWPELNELVASTDQYDREHEPAPTTGAERAAAVEAMPSDQFTSIADMNQYSASQAALTQIPGMNVNTSNAVVNARQQYNQSGDFNAAYQSLASDPTAQQAFYHSVYG